MTKLLLFGGGFKAHLRGGQYEYLWIKGLITSQNTFNTHQTTPTHHLLPP